MLVLWLLVAVFTSSRTLDREDQPGILGCVPSYKQDSCFVLPRDSTRLRELVSFVTKTGTKTRRKSPDPAFRSNTNGFLRVSTGICIRLCFHGIRVMMMRSSANETP
ncbi:hypothetical protein QBC34DRAFT_407156 [Podospora aff. communis PSN243]|uniref:Secreted protein n=1 Tax=Podospora aff. communis PSN243 TaxID=3040156 RepID=A0AAV9GLM9_9PEZI|nr:hypothetical protein QBC34DRAFT_407156 [Podospora aff. communis PSN243]